MKKGTIILIAVIAVIAIIAFSCVGTYNSLVAQRENCLLYTSRCV